MSTRWQGMAAAAFAATAVAATAIGVGAGRAAAQCVGNCGTLGPDGVVAAPPGFSTYGWVSSSRGTVQGGLPGIGGTNGSRFTSALFSASAGQSLEFYFNYVTSDGAGFSDYGYARLLNADRSVAATLFTARTTPDGNTVPGFGLPPAAAVVTPATVTVKDGTTWAPLEGSSGACYAAGCGFTDWVHSQYTVNTAGNYLLEFGVTNWDDEIFDSGLAFQGATIANEVIVATPGASQALPILPTPCAGPASPATFCFNNVISGLWYDPPLTDAYDFAATDGSLFTAVGMPTGFTGSFDVYYGPGFSTLFGSFLGGQTADFGALGGLDAFRIAGIQPRVDADDPAAFPVQMFFNQQSGNSFTMTPLVAAVPEPSTWMLLGAGLLGVAGGARRRRLAA